MKSWLRFLLLGVFGVAAARAQDTTDAADDLEQSLDEGAPIWSASYPEPGPLSGFRLGASIDWPVFDFLISTGEGRSDSTVTRKRVEYGPTFAPNLSLELSYKALSLWASFRPDFSSAESDAVYGRTRYQNYRAQYAVSNFAFDLFYQNYKGFFADLSGRQGGRTEVGSISKMVDASSIIKREDLASRHYGALVYGAVPVWGSDEIPRAFHAAFGRKDRPDSLEIDAVANVYFNHLGIDGDYAWIPPSYQPQFGSYASLQSLSWNALGLGLGAAVSVPFAQQMAFNFLALVGAGLQGQSYRLADGSHGRAAWMTSMNSKIAWTYMGDHSECGLVVNWDVWSTKFSKLWLDSNNLSFGLEYAYNF